MNDPAQLSRPQSRTASIDRRAKRNFVLLPALFLAGLWGFYNYRITVSIGVAQMNHTHGDGQLLDEDRALCRAKAQGRNRTMVLEPRQDDHPNGGELLAHG